ncbi:hydrophobic protein [Streptomyces sp. RS10V-4]|nr:hydrophobic protein [Streptomyces rhizoryzae]
MALIVLVLLLVLLLAGAGFALKLLWFAVIALVVAALVVALLFRRTGPRGTGGRRRW